MIRPHVLRVNVNVVAAADLPNQISALSPQSPLAAPVAVLRAENKVIIQLVNHVRRPTSGLHDQQRTANYRKASPEGEGLYPPRIGR